MSKCPKCGAVFDETAPKITIDCKLFKINAIGKRSVYITAFVVLVLVIGFLLYTKYRYNNYPPRHFEVDNIEKFVK